MGMYDTVTTREPHPKCPACAADLTSFQTKDLAEGFDIYKVGVPSDGLEGFADAEIDIYTPCPGCGAWVDAKARIEDRTIVDVRPRPVDYHDFRRMHERAEKAEADAFALRRRVGELEERIVEIGAEVTAGRAPLAFVVGEPIPASEVLAVGEFGYHDYEMLRHGDYCKYTEWHVHTPDGSRLSFGRGTRIALLAGPQPERPADAYEEEAAEGADAEAPCDE